MPRKGLKVKNKENTLYLQTFEMPRKSGMRFLDCFFTGIIPDNPRGYCAGDIICV